MTTSTIPTSDVDLFAPEILLEPFSTYKELRDLGPAVWLERLEMYAIPRYADVRAGLRDWKNLSSLEGVVFSDWQNGLIRNTGALCTEPPVHTRHRGVIADRITPSALQRSADFVETTAHRYVDEIIERGTFDAAEVTTTYLAEVVSHFVGFPKHCLENLVQWGEASFDAAGPENEKLNGAVDILGGMFELLSALTIDDMMPGSAGHGVMEAAVKGEEFGWDERVSMLWNFTGPALDSTISGLGTALWRLAADADQWRMLRDDRALAASAVNEALRYHAPIQSFTRTVRNDWDVSGSTLAGGSRVVVMFGSGNRDERHYTDPDRFDIRRDARDHLGFGNGIHTCVGAPLARLELTTFLSVLASRIATLDLAAEPTFHVGNMLRKLESLPITVTAV